MLSRRALLAIISLATGFELPALAAPASKLQAAPTAITIECKAPSFRLRAKVTEVGPLKFDNAIAEIEDSTISIRTYPNFRGGQIVLSGNVLKQETSTQPTGNEITGIALFDQGDLIAQLNVADQKESVFTVSGAIEGIISFSPLGKRISVFADDGTRRTIAQDEVLYVRSHRAYTFQAVVLGPQPDLKPDNGLTVSFKPTSQRRSFSMTSVVPAKDAEDEFLPDAGPLDKIRGVEEAPILPPLWQRYKP